MTGLTSGINSVSNAWRSSSPGLSCCLCPGEPPTTAAASPPRNRAGVAGSTDTKISPSPRRTPPRCTRKDTTPMSSALKKPGTRAPRRSRRAIWPYLLRRPPAGTGIGGGVKKEVLGGVPPPPAASVHRRCRRDRGEGGRRRLEWAKGDWWRGDDGRRRSRSYWTRVKGFCFGEARRGRSFRIAPWDLRDVAEAPPSLNLEWS
jgi:hypothetical protein